jgi:hypothetical protein
MGLPKQILRAGGERHMDHDTVRTYRRNDQVKGMAVFVCA